MLSMLRENFVVLSFSEALISAFWLVVGNNDRANDVTRDMNIDIGTVPTLLSRAFFNRIQQ